MTIKIQIQKEKLVFLGGGRKGAFKTNFVKGINSLAPPPTKKNCTLALNMFKEVVVPLLKTDNRIFQLYSIYSYAGRS